jgi:hypothetical protein
VSGSYAGNLSSFEPVEAHMKLIQRFFNDEFMTVTILKYEMKFLYLSTKLEIMRSILEKEADNVTNEMQYFHFICF